MSKSPSRPLRIGISAAQMHPDPARITFKGKRLLYMEESLFHWVLGGGAMAFLIPSAPPRGVSLDDLVGALDGVLMSGGVDMAPESYGETALRPEWAGDPIRDANEVAIVRAALAQDKPLLGVCRGHQVLNVALGGTLFQDIQAQNPHARVHRDFEVYESNQHAVRIESPSGLGRLFSGLKEGRINSIHHQAVKDLAPELRAEAWSSEDGIVEAHRLKGRAEFLVGVQWHPEFQDLRRPADAALLSPDPILQEFLAAARLRAR